MNATQGPRTPATDFTLEVRTELPQADYAALHALAEENHTTIGRLVRECVRRTLHEPIPERRPGPTTPAPTKSSRGPYVSLTEEHADAVRELYAEGLNDADIARRLGASKTPTRNLRASLGLPPRPTGRPRTRPAPTPEEPT